MVNRVCVLVWWLAGLMPAFSDAALFPRDTQIKILCNIMMKILTNAFKLHGKLVPSEEVFHMTVNGQLLTVICKNSDWFGVVSVYSEPAGTVPTCSQVESDRVSGAFYQFYQSTLGLVQ
jgi:hypothetical protein